MFTNQVTSFFVTLVVIVIFWWLIGFPANIVSPNVASIFEYLDMRAHFFNALDSGKIKLSDIVYYLSLIALGIFTGTVAVETRRWR
jgi:hypothetical protein